jgi:cytosine/adenosine deaminase-related metal-dependent hydrolase
MPTVYSARWVVPVSSPNIAGGAIAVEGGQIIAVGTHAAIIQKFPDAIVRDLGDAAIIPGLVNAHTHLELTAMRGFLEDAEFDFFTWLRKLTSARLQRMTADDLYVSSAWGACEAVRAGVTCMADASDSARESMRALSDVGLRGIVFQESFGPDPRNAAENFSSLKTKIASLREIETSLVKCGVSPHAPYTVCAPQLEMIAEFATAEQLPLMMHAAETEMECALLREGSGAFAAGLRARGIDWEAPGVSTIQYLKAQGILHTRPLLAHCITVDDADIETIRETQTRVAHCPKSNAKLGHGVAPFAKFLAAGVAVGLGSDSVASNNTCDLLEEARFALLTARSAAAGDHQVVELSAANLLQTATAGGARALGLDGIVGELKEGLQADFAAVSFAGPHQIPSYDPAGTLIFSSSGRDVLLTVVAGREVYRESLVMTVDEDRLRARMKEIAAKLAGLS